MTAWGRLPAGTSVAYIHFEADGLPLRELPRLARRGEVWADARPTDAQDAIDLAVAGAGAVIAWYGAVPDEQLRAMAAELGPTFILATEPPHLQAAVALADELECLLLTSGCEAPPDVPALALQPWEGGRSLIRVTGPPLGDEE
jgi:hypothetical protein